MCWASDIIYIDKNRIDNSRIVPFPCNELELSDFERQTTTDNCHTVWHKKTISRGNNELQTNLLDVYIMKINFCIRMSFTSHHNHTTQHITMKTGFCDILPTEYNSENRFRDTILFYLCCEYVCVCLVSIRRILIGKCRRSEQNKKCNEN